MEAKQTPLIELLERIPQDARLIVEHDQFSSSSHPVGRMCHEAAAALRAALAEPVQEPVALPDWFNHAFPSGKLEAVGFHMPTPRAYAEEMYKRWKSRIAKLEAELAGLADAQRKPLSDEEVERLIYENTKINPNVADDRELLGYIVNAARAIEAAHGIQEKK